MPEALGFHIFATLVAVDGAGSVREIEAFHRLFEDASWCRSSVCKAWMDYASKNYTELWKSYVAGNSPANVEDLRNHLAAAWWDCPDDERARLREDIDHIARQVGGANFGFSRLLARGRNQRAAQVLLGTLLDAIEAAGADAVEEIHGLEETEGADAAAIRSPVLLSGTSRRVETSDGDARPVWTRGKITVQCVQVIDETHDIKTFRFRAVDDSAFQYLPGQSATLELEIDGKRVLRTYTISSTPTRQDILHFTIKRVPNGLVSNWMCDHVAPGFEMTVKGPGGRFSWTHERASKVAFLSGGSGVTPLLSMTRYIADRAENVDIAFFHCARSHEDLVCDDELRNYERSMPAFRRIYAFSCLAEDDPWEGMRGYIDAGKIRKAIPDILSRHVYLCGPVPFMVAAKEALETLRFPMNQFFQESFGGAPAGGKSAPATSSKVRSSTTQSLAALVPSPSVSAREGRKTLRPSMELSTGAVRAVAAAEASERFSSPAPEAAGDVVVFLKSKVTVPVGDGEMLFDVAEGAGVEVESSCRAGTCGTCAMRLVSGTVEMDEESGLDDEKREAGFVLTCVGRVKGRVEVDA